MGRLALGTMTWGRDTDEHEAREQLTALLEAGGNLVELVAIHKAMDETDPAQLMNLEYIKFVIADALARADVKVKK